MATGYGLASDWLNSNASAFIPDSAIWVNFKEFSGLTIQAADEEPLPAIKIAAETDEDALYAATTLGPEPSQHQRRLR